MQPGASDSIICQNPPHSTRLYARVRRPFVHPRLIALIGLENRKMSAAFARKKLKNKILGGMRVEVLIPAVMPNLEYLGSC